MDARSALRRVESCRLRRAPPLLRIRHADFDPPRRCSATERIAISKRAANIFARLRFDDETRFSRSAILREKNIRRRTEVVKL